MRPVELPPPRPPEPAKRLNFLLNPRGAVTIAYTNSARSLVTELDARMRFGSTLL